MDADGRVRPVTILIGGDSSATRIALLDAGSLTEFSGTDHLDCLVQVRRQLEREGRLLCCQGARPDVHPSGQLRQFTHGREAYVRPPEGRGEIRETVDVFAPAAPAEVVSLEEQRAAILGAFHARHPADRI